MDKEQGKISYKPHDRVFRKSMAIKAVALDFCRTYLPKKVQQAINTDIFELCPQSFLDTKLKERVTDVLYRTEFNGESGYVYLLLEHQTKPDKWMPLRLLRYFIGIWEHHRHQYQSELLPVIYPVVVYNGQADYTYSTDILDLFNDPASLMVDILCKPFQLVDLSKIGDNKLRAQHYAGALQLLMKHIRQSDILHRIHELSVQLKYVEREPYFQDYLEVLVSYVLSADNPVTYEELARVLQDEPDNLVGEKLMTIAENLRKEAKAEGMHQGMHQGMLEGKAKGILEGQAKEQTRLILAMLAKGKTPAEIEALTDLPLSTIQAVRQRHYH